MRAAFAPTSLRPTRDFERTSMRLPAPAGVMRTTTSSLKPNQRVVWVASMRPCPRSTSTISHPMSRAAWYATAHAESGVVLRPSANLGPSGRGGRR